MGWGRVVSSVCASGAVAGCAVLAIGMGHAVQQPAADTAHRHPTSDVVTTSVPPVPADPMTTTSTSDAPQPVPLTHTAPAPATSAVPTTGAPSSSTPAPAASSAPHTTAAPAAPRATATPHPAAARHAASHPARRPAPRHAAPNPPARRGGSLPLHYATYSATRVITVVATHTWSTTARLQAWVRAPGGGWLRSGAEWTAHVGSQGLTTSPSEFKSATPIGSFSLTRAFGRYSDPGTSLPYHRVDTRDYWISHRGSTYNTLQHCTTSGCHTSADEHLIDANPEYNYAAVINYNTAARVYPNGSAFFLHVSDGSSTAGCVSVAQSKVISLLRWLTPSAHPRILIGVHS